VVDGFSEWVTKELSQNRLVPVTFFRSKDGKVKAKLNENVDSLEDFF
jgi:hypothetical protein